MMSTKKKKISLVALHATSADDNVKYSHPSKEATNALLLNSAMNIASYEDDVDLRPVKKEEETDSSEMPIEDACSSSNQVQPIIKEEECNDGFGTMVKTGFGPSGPSGPSASPMANSNSDKNKIGADPDKAVKIEECDIDEDPLSHIGNTSRFVVSDGNCSISLKPTSSSNQVKKEELDDNPSIVMHFDDSPLHSAGRNSSFEKKTIKRNSTGFQSTEVARLPDRELLFKCATCEKRFPTYYELLVHELDHAEETFNKCPVCERSLSTRATLMSHLLIHTGERPYICSVCGMSFNRSAYLNRHYRVHAGERPFECTLCGKGFTTKQSLLAHERVHTGTRSFICAICGKCFSYQCSLTRHLRLHTEEFKCSLCGMQFANSFALQKHAKIHTGITSGNLRDVQQQPVDQSSEPTSTNG